MHQHLIDAHMHLTAHDYASALADLSTALGCANRGAHHARPAIMRAINATRRAMRRTVH